MTDWIALGRDAAGVRGFALRGATITARAVAAEDREVLARLDVAGPVVRIGEGADRLPARVLPEAGLALPVWEQADPPDVIGAWVRLGVAGFVAERPHWDGVIRMAEGGISHWIHISAEEAISTQSFLTPRLVAALGGATEPDAGAISDSLSRPERLAAHLRAAEISGNAGAITGHLMGAELAAARPYWLGRQVALATEDANAWISALTGQGVPCTGHDPDSLLTAGLAALARSLEFED